MKMKVIAIMLMLALMAILPFAATKCGTEVETEATMSTADNAKTEIKATENVNSDEDKAVCGLVAALYKSDYSAETVKAIAILLNNDYSLQPDKFDLDSNDVCIYKENADNAIKEIYPQIESVVSSATDLLIYHNGKNVYVPYSTISNGNTVADESSDYIISVASPWDCFSENYDKNAECFGVSIEGLVYLCKNGMSAEEALSWYLPKCEIR